MLKENGAAELKAYAQRSFRKLCEKINDHIYYFQGYGHSNATLIIGEKGCILIDSLDSDTRGARLKQEIAAITDKPVTSLIFTHSHPDHTGGSKAFEGAQVIAHEAMRPVLPFGQKIAQILGRRGTMQFGIQLSDEELITQGMGPREGRSCGDGSYNILPVTNLIKGDQVVVMEIEGITLHLIPAVGETDDQMYIWLPEEKILCCGDNFYACFPNLYALRGGQYRDVAAWVESLDLLLSYPVEILLPGHIRSIHGNDEIRKTIGTYRDALSSVLMQTLEGLNEGKTADELAASVQLPEEIRNGLLLGEHYGSVEWSVRSICNAYVGWFDGNPTNIHKLDPQSHGRAMIDLAGGEEALCRKLQEAMDRKNYLWAMELCDSLIESGCRTDEANKWKAQCCLALAEQETSANGRHYYQTSAKKLDSNL